MVPLVLLAQPAHAESTGEYSMDSETSTLTLTDYVSDEAITLEEDTTIVVQGECILSAGGPAISAYDQNITLTGSGSLTLTNGYFSCADLTLTEDFTGSLSVKNMPGLYLNGSYTQKNGSVTVATLLQNSPTQSCTYSFLGGSFSATTMPGITYNSSVGLSIIVDGGTVSSHGFISGSKDFHMKSGSVKADQMPGLSFTDGTITIDGGTVELNNAFITAKDIIVNGGTINTEGPSSTPAVSVYNRLTLNDGTVNAKNFISAGGITVNGGTLDVTASDVTCLSVGGSAQVPGDILQTGGTINCKQTADSSAFPLTKTGKITLTGGTFTGSTSSSIGLYALDSIAIDKADVQCTVADKGAAIATEPNGTISLNKYCLVSPAGFTFGTATYPFPTVSSTTIEDHVFKVLLAADGSPVTSFKTDSSTATERELADAKTTAIAELDKINLANYKEPEKSIVMNAVADAKKAIESATSVAAVNTAFAAANATIKAQGVYNAKLPKVAKVKPAKGKKMMTVKWKKLSKKNAKKITGIEIQYAQNKAFTKNAKMIKVKKSKKAAKIKKLASKKTYWVKVRTYKNTSAGKQVGKWSKAKKVKVK